MERTEQDQLLLEHSGSPLSIETERQQKMNDMEKQAFIAAYAAAYAASLAASYAASLAEKTPVRDSTIEGFHEDAEKDAVIAGMSAARHLRTVMWEMV